MPSASKGTLLGGQRRGAWHRTPQLSGLYRGDRGSCRLDLKRLPLVRAEGGAGSYLLCASSTAEPKADSCVSCGSVCRNLTAAQSSAPAPAPARPGRSTPRLGEGRWARGLGWAGRPLKLLAPGSGRASAPS